MKLLLILLSVLSLSAFAEGQPYLVKHSASGFVPDEWFRFEKCQVFDQEVLISRKYASTATVNYQIAFSADELNELIVKASEEELREEPNLTCDGPSTTVKAFIQIEGLEELQPMLLYSTGGCGAHKQIRSGPYSLALNEIVGTFCTLTY